jgi:hypothetical protein
MAIYRLAVLLKAPSRALNLPVVMLRKLPVALLLPVKLPVLLLKAASKLPPSKMALLYYSRLGGHALRWLHEGWGWTARDHSARLLARPTTGDFVRLKVAKNGMSAGDICKVMQDDRDSSPYKLRKVGSSLVKQYFNEYEV